jgi:hypothetical protein
MEHFSQGNNTMNEGQRPIATNGVELGLLRAYGPAALAYLLATALTGAHFWGDSIDYAEGALTGHEFWDFGHLFWRPLGWLLLKLTPAGLFDSAEERVRPLLLLLGVCWLAGLGSVLFLRAFLRESGVRSWAAELTTLFFLLSQTFLNYAQTASSYVPGLCGLLLGCFLLARAARRPERSSGTAVAAGAALAAALGFWLPYLWALPAVGLIPLFLGGWQRSQLRLSFVAALSCAALVALMNAAALAAQGITTVDGALAWIKASQHGIHGINGLPRMVFGLARSFIYLGEDGTLFRRYLGKDPLNPVGPFDVLQSVWPIALFYLFVGGLVFALARSAVGRRMLTLLLVAAVPTLAFGIAWQGGDMERYLPLYPFVFLAVAGLFNDPRRPRLCQGLAVVFFLVMVGYNAPALLRPVLERRQQELAAQANELVPRLRPGSRVFTVNDEVAKLRRHYPLNPLGHRLTMCAVHEAGTTRVAEWRALLCRRMRTTWEQGGDVWVTRRVFRAKPQAEWLWVEDRRSELRWSHVHEFFKDFETIEVVGGEDGYVRLRPPPPSWRARPTSIERTRIESRQTIARWAGGRGSFQRFKANDVKQIHERRPVVDRLGGIAG